MQLNNVVKGLMLVVTVIAITACSFHKNNYEESSITAGSGTSSIDLTSNNVSSDKQASLQIQELQRNNIVYFDLDKSVIRSEFSQLLDAHANFLRSNLSDKKVTIEGHADERGTPEYNIALGERRANAVKMYLQGKGISAEQIAIISYGKDKPAVLGQDEITYAKNRRAILVY
ncbi:peptidoglycan-associated lipoprotein Pal [Candidatus Hoaglandella endobia]|uniref:Peptidoglycan-associated protein n=1 Tax=Candidatus Hoaglandella endobia TaxID=1778263 RepID=A0A143WTL6_9ENTR|nr:peptidoglycan-associated lipoprotein Pal [Candidatus Hoaglandella endobia]CUX97179.1 Peptidoglycan-associated lipoprotein precursor [Candidatus Hoaglandella endobia]